MSSDFDDIIPPVDRNLLRSELTEELFVCNTNKGGNQIYIVNYHNAPNTLREIGRLREVAFRSAGGGTGKDFDLDDYDVRPVPYEQLIVFSPEDDEIVGGYRFIDCSKVLNEGTDKIPLSTAHYFDFSEKFIKEYLPHTIELGRSWVQPQFQPSQNPRKGLFALANIWDGLSAIVDLHPQVKYFFGKVTMYPDYNQEARDILLYFVRRFFPDNDELLTPYYPLEIKPDSEALDKMFDGIEFKEAYKVLQKMIREKGENIPPLLGIYMNISDTMKSFGTAVNPDFGGVEETGILVTIEDIYEETRQRHSTGKD